MSGRSLERHIDYPALIVGGYGYRNVGDEAMLAGLLELVDRRRVTVLSRTPAETRAMHGVRTVSAGRAISALRTHRTVLIGGGALFSADMGALGRLLPLYGLFARSLGREVLLEGVSFDTQAGGAHPGRIHGWATRRLAVSATRVGVRDDRSAELLSEWGVQAQVGPDLSADVVPRSLRVGTELLRHAGVKPGRPVVGLCLTDVNAGLGSAMASAIVEVVQALPEFEFCFIPLSQHPFVGAHNDLLMAQRIQRAAPRLRILDGSHHPADILAVFSRLSAVVGMRYHSLLFADRCNVPLVPVAYAPKCRAWLAERGLAGTRPAAGAISAALQDVVAQPRAA